MLYVNYTYTTAVATDTVVHTNSEKPETKIRDSITDISQTSWNVPQYIVWIVQHLGYKDLIHHPLLLEKKFRTGGRSTGKPPLSWLLLETLLRTDCGPTT